MKNKILVYNRIAAVLIFIGLPVLFWALSDVPKRSYLKESISLLTLIAFSLMLLQFFLARSNRTIIREHTMGRIVLWHRVLGYVFVTLFLVHPVLIVLPRYFEAGIEPVEAFYQILAATENPGIVLGIAAWLLMLVIGILSLFRKVLPLNYKNWRFTHGILSVLFIAISTGHVLMLGRHIGFPMMTFILLTATIGVFQLMITYFTKAKKQA